MSKYIIDVGDAYIRHGLERTLTIPVRINEHEDHWMDTRIPVTPYTEPDLEQVNAEKDKIFDEARARGYDEGRARGYQEGLFDAWECARKVVALSIVNRRKVFGSEYMHSILEKHTASEAIEKIRQYEQEKKDDHDREKVAALADDIGIHKLYALVREIRGE